MNDVRLLKELEHYVVRFYTYADMTKLYKVKIMEHRFYNESYKIWAAKEVIKYVKKSKKGVLGAVEDFRDMMDDFAMMNHPDTRMFSVAYDVATDILDFVICRR